MFYFLHRLVKGCFLLLLLGCMVWLWTQRRALEPLWVWYEVYENGGIQRTAPLPVLRGEGTTVLNGHTFQMKSAGKVYIVGLTGFDAPAEPLSGDELQRERARRQFLRDAVVGKPVRVEVTFSNDQSLLGVVHAGATNVNLHYLMAGLSTFNRDYVRSTPRGTQYRFFAALRSKRDELSLLADHPSTR